MSRSEDIAEKKNRNFTVPDLSLDKEDKDWKDALVRDKLTWNHMSDLKM